MLTAGGTSNGLSFTVTGTLAMASAELARQIGVYPNPATAAVSVELPTALRGRPATVALLDALGRTVSRHELPANVRVHELPLRGAAPGLYTLRIQTAAGAVARPLVVN